MNNSKSKYWKNMYIDHLPNQDDPSGEENKTIISTEIPIDFDKPNYEDDLDLTIFNPFTISDVEKHGEEIVTFLNKNNMIVNGITEMMSIDLLKSIAELKSFLFILRFKKTNGIMGCMVNIPLTTNTPENTKYTLTTYLCVHKQLRHKAISMLIIRKALIFSHSIERLCSYYLLAQPFSKSAIPLQRWMRPINVKKTLEKGFEFVTGKGKSDRTDIKAKLRFAVTELPKTVSKEIIDPNNENLLKKTYDFMKKVCVDKSTSKFMWLLNTIDEWKQWCAAFPTLLVIKHTKKGNEELSGLVSIQCKQILIPDTNSVSNVAFIPFHISESKNNNEFNAYLYRAALIYSKEKKQDVLFCLENGDLTSNILKGCNAVMTTGKMFLDFYNVVVKDLSPSDIYVPLL
jgi:hypothetical protein